MSEFKPVRSLTLDAYKASKGVAKLEMFRSKDEQSLYLAKPGEPHLPVCFVSTKINSLADVKPGAMVSTQIDSTTGAEYDCLHNAGKEALGSL